MRAKTTWRSPTSGRAPKWTLLLVVVAMVVAACSSDTTDATTTTSGGDGGAETTAAGEDPTTTAGDGGGDFEGMTSCEIAVQEAQQYSGTTLDVTWESGLQAIDPITFSAPLWEEQTGININVVELDPGAQFSTPVADHIAGGSSFDVLSFNPAVTPDFVSGGVIDPIDDYVDMYMVPEDLEDYHPLYKGLSIYQGQRWGLFDDGDVLILYYRTDLFEDPDLQAAYEEQEGEPLAVPTTWEDLNTVSQFFSDQLGPDVYGWATWRSELNEGLFLQQFRSNGGQPFDVDNDMRSLINSDIGVQTANEMLGQIAAGPPGAETFGTFDGFAQYLEGKLAMTLFWPPLGRWSAAYGVDNENLSFLPESQVQDVTGYAVMPGGHGQHSGAFNLAISADSDSKEAAYLFIQWMTCPEISLQRVMLDTALRDPYRLSHFESPEYQALWPDAPEYLQVLNEAANVALLDLIIPGATQYNTAINQAMTAIWAGTDPQEALDTAAAEWDRITDEIGVDDARQAWLDYLEFPGSSLETTVDALGLGN